MKRLLLSLSAALSLVATGCCCDWCNWGCNPCGSHCGRSCGSPCSNGACGIGPTSYAAPIGGTAYVAPGYASTAYGNPVLQTAAVPVESLPTY